MFKSFRIRFIGAAVAAVLCVTACETSKRNFPESGAKSEENLPMLDSPNKLVGTVDAEKIGYKVPREQLMLYFTRQFNDGTVINQAMVRKVQNSSKDKPMYFLVGLGLRNGMFRAMAMQLELTTDNELYLSSASERYILVGKGCQMCYFNFGANGITGTSCSDNSGGGTCDIQVLDKNTFFPEKK